MHLPMIIIYYPRNNSWKIQSRDTENQDEFFYIYNTGDYQNLLILKI